MHDKSQESRELGMTRMMAVLVAALHVIAAAPLPGLLPDGRLESADKLIKAWRLDEDRAL